MGDETLAVRITAVFVVALASILGCLAAFTVKGTGTRSSAAAPMRLLKCLAGGVIVSVGFVHVLADAADQLGRVTDYPLAFTVAMLGCLLVLLLNMTLRQYVTTSQIKGTAASSFKEEKAEDGRKDGEVEIGVVKRHTYDDAELIVQSFQNKSLLVAYMMEVGIIFHSVIIGVGLGVQTTDLPTVQSLLVALCFHQLFEGMGLAAAILEAELPSLKMVTMIALFCLTTSVGIALGIGFASTYNDDSPVANWVQGLTNAVAAGILIQLGLVEMITEEMSNLEVGKHVTLHIQMFAAMLVGAGMMSFIAIWA